MGQIIDLATFKFNDTELIASIANVQKSLLELKTKVSDNNKEYKANQQSINLLIASQNALSISGNENTKAYKLNQIELSNLNTKQTDLLKNNAVLSNNISGLNGNLREQQTALGGLSKATTDTATPYKDLNAEMNAMKLSAKNLGAELIILEREGKKGTAEYAELEKKFKQTSESASALDKQFKALDGTVGDNQRNVGDYKNQIKDAFAEMNIFNGGIGGFIQRSNEAGGAGNLLKNSFSGVSNGIVGMTKASLGFLATPIGAIIGILAVVVGSLFVAFSKLDPVMDKIAQLTAGFGGAFTKATNIITGFVANITSLGDAFSKIGNLILNPIDTIKKFTSELGNAAKQAAKLKESEQDLGDIKAIYEVRQKNIEKDIALDRIKLKNKKLTSEQIQEIENRIESNFAKSATMRNEVNDKTNKHALELAKQTSIKLTNEELKRLENSIKIGDLQVANELLNGERIVNGKKQTTNRLNSDAYKAIQDAISAQQDSNNKKVQDEERTQAQIEKANDKADARREKAQADAEKARDKAKQLRDKQIEDQKKETEDQIKNAQDLANAQIETAKLTLTSYLIDNQSKLTDAKRLTQDLINEENKRLDIVLEKNRDILTAETRTKQDILNAEIKSLKDKESLTESEKLKLADLNAEKLNLAIDYTNKDRELVNATETAKKENKTKYANQIAEEEKIRQAQKFQLQLNEMELQGASEYEIKTAQLDNETQLELQKLKEKEDAKFLAGVEKRLEQNTLLTEEEAIKEQLNFDLQNAKDENEKVRIQNQLDAITLIEQASADKKKAIVDISEDAKRKGYLETFSMIKGVFAEHTAIAKAAGLAEVAITTQAKFAEAALKAKAFFALGPPGVPSGINASVQAGLILAQGAVSAGKIAGFADGGIITDGQPIQRANGDDVLITAKRGEVILNEKHQSMLGGARTFANIGVPGFATGGVVGSNLQSVQNNFTQTLDITAMAEMIGQKVYEGATVGTASGSQKGIIGLSENRQIANNANF